jgi:nucleoside-diphosphate-sugar epimerase
VPATDRPILLTGATGFVGMAVLARLLAAGHEVHCLVRANDDDDAEARLRAILNRVQAPSTGRTVAVAGDQTAPRQGLGDRHFELPIDEARAINVEGTRRVLDFAAAVPGLERVTYVSTAYVAGDRRGTVYEDDREPSRFRNSYERSKHEAEAVVRASDVPWTIVRPSIVVGETTTGWTASFNVLYAPLRAFSAGAYPVIPARRRAPVDVVPVDYVADAVAALAEHPEADGGTFHLTASSRASSVGEIMELTTGRIERRPPRLVSPRIYQRFLHPLVLRRVAPSTRRLLERSEVYFPYFAMRLRFDDARARALLDPMGITPTPLSSYFERIIEFAHAARWGRRPLDRAEAAEIAGTSADVRPVVLSPSRGAAAVPA